jgi:hypothetical protein
MSRSEPNVNLNYCESQVVIKAVLADGTVLRLGTGSLENVPESDGSNYGYLGKIIRDSDVRTSTTTSANQIQLDTENVDKVLGLTINNLESTLIGAKVVCSKVFTDIATADLNQFNPAFWFEGFNILDVSPNQNFSVWPDKSGNARHASGQAIFKWKAINGYNGVQFGATDEMVIPGSFPLAQVFAVFSTPNSTWSNSGSIIGASPNTFGFVSGSNIFGSPLPGIVRNNGAILTSPYALDLDRSANLLNVFVNNPTIPRNYKINNLGGVHTDFTLSGLVGFSTALTSQQTQLVEHVLARRYQIEMPYKRDKLWERKVLLTGEIATARVNEETVSITILSQTAPNVAFIAARPVQSKCSLPFKSRACGYVGPLVVCNKTYDSEDGCAGRGRQFRYAGLVIKGEINTPISGGIDTVVGTPERYWPGDYYPDTERHRMV